MSPSDAPARVIGGRYSLREAIGRGGMGTVWHGRDDLLGRDVAVKEVRFPPEVGKQEQDELRERTLREARATARLSHPNVITTYDVVEEDGRPWIVMELFKSRALSQVLHESGALPPHQVAELGLQMLSALEASHKQGIVHRDVKPGNVLIADDGRAVLTDFGIATMAGDPSLTSTGVVLGSPAYMSPERARGQRPGEQADLWSLGATLYAAAEGRPPFDADNALGILTKVISDPVDPPTVGGPLGEVIVGLLEKDPAQRMSISATRGLLQRATADRSSGPIPVPADATVALDRSSRTEALPVDPELGGTSAAPMPSEGSVDEQSRHHGRRALVIAALVALALLAALTAAALTDDRGDSAAGPRGSQSPTGPAPSSASSPERSSTESASPEESPGNTLPEGFVLYEDPTGFSVAVPTSWKPVHEGTRVDIKEPGGSRFLRIDQTDKPKEDPEKDWKRQEKSVEKRLEGYERIEIQEVDYRDYPAADWEFTFGEDGTTHVLNRGFVTGERGYALYFSTPEDEWEESEDVFDVAAETFQPAG